jgi:hypothetical protein
MDERGIWHNWDGIQVVDYVNPLYTDDGVPLIDVTYSNPGLRFTDFDEYQQSQGNVILQQIQSQWNGLKSATIGFHLIKYKVFQDVQSELNELNSQLTNFINQNIGKGQYFDPTNVIKVNITQLEQIKKLAVTCNKSASDVTFLDFLIFYTIPTSLFSPALDLLFHQYFLKSKYYPHLTNGVKTPWDSFNEILEGAHFKYKLSYKESTAEDYPSPVTLIDDNDEIQMTLSDLSSGESTIMSLIFALYNSSNDGKFPQVILFDEPDAHLHPSMTDLFLSVVQDVIVKKNKVKVIMTTHSPSTVALAPKDSIYIMSKTLGYPEKAEKAHAIKSLMTGLNSLFVSYENRRQVFVESEYDVMFYEKIYQKLNKI